MTPIRLARSLLLASTLAIAACAPTADTAVESNAPPTGRITETAALIEAALAAPHRSAENRARDIHRHPRDTLTFFGLRPDMTVVEIMPGGGWYTEILAPVLRERGRLYAAHPNPASSDYAARAVARIRDKLAATPSVYDRVQPTIFDKNEYDALAPAGSADMVLTFRNVHNFMDQGIGDQAFAAFHRALKPGGILGVVEHRLPEDRPLSQQATSGYVKQSTVVRLAEAAGFQLVEAVEINANPKDTADHPKGVWTLPPSLALGDQDRAKYAAIGESDRMTLKFVKPAK